MTPFDSFKAQLQDFATNNVTALEGKIQITLAEAETLRGIWEQLPGDQQAAAKQVAKDRGIDVSRWV